MTLNLEAKTKGERKVKAYLEANASDILAEKINNGVHIQKDGRALINKKTLAGFMKFACDEAKKQAEKGVQSACIDDDVVYGWAVHYFEEESIEGTLYNEDGTEYKPPKPVTQSKPITIYTTPKPQPKPQMSLFELMENNANEEKPSENAQDASQKTVQPDKPAPDEEPCENTETEEEPTEEELREAAETEDELPEPVMTEKTKAVQMQGRPSTSGICRYRTNIPIISSCSAAEISTRRSAMAHRYFRKISHSPSRAEIAGCWNVCQWSAFRTMPLTTTSAKLLNAA